MKAVVCKEFGPIENLVVEDLPSPTPGPGEVLIDVRAAGVNFPDGLMVRGEYQMKPPRPFTPGNEVAGVVTALGEPDLDHVVCYQSRATPQKWLDPSIETIIEQAAEEKVAVLVVPIAFVSEHSETLVELDVEYRDLAEKLGVPGYFRVPAQNSNAGFIDALANLVLSGRRHGAGLCSFAGDRACPAIHTDCPMRLAA